MKKIILILFLIAIPILSQENTINYYEYWFDNNFSEKVAVDVGNPETIINVQTSISIESLSPGLHHLTLRYGDSWGNWSVAQSSSFFKLEQAELNSMVYYEYWFNQDYENKVTDEITPIDTINVITNISLENIPAGLNSFSIRFRDSRGNWSIAQSSSFFKLEQAELNSMVYYEYWFNQDYENKVSGEVTPIDTINVITNISLENIPAGLNSFSIRFRDSRGNWSVAQSSSFFKLEQSNQNVISEYRYWFNENFNQISTVKLTTTIEQLDLIREIIIPELNLDSLHSIHLQYKDAYGKWSSVVADSFRYAGGTLSLIPPVQLLPGNGASGISLNPLMQWRKLIYADSYILQIATDTNFANVIQNFNITDTSFTLQESLVLDSIYFWRIRTKSGIFISAWSGTWSFSTGEQQLLSSPLLSEPENNSTNLPINPNLVWLAVENATSYTLQVSLTENFNDFVLNQNGIEETQFQLFGLEYNTQYFWRVNATSGTQTSNWSEVWSFTTAPSINFGLSAWYKFDGDYNDYSGNNYDGTNVGTVWTENRFGEPNKALLFDGSSSGVRLDNGYPPVFSGSLTVSMWAYFNDSNRSILLGSYNSLNNVNFEKHVTPNNSLRIWWDNGQIDIYTAANPVNINNWYLLTYIRDKEYNQFRFYVNGQEIATYPNTGNDVIPAGPFWIGRDSRTGITVHNGKIDDVRIYNRVLSTDEIQFLYNEEPIVLNPPILTIPLNNSSNNTINQNFVWQAVENATYYTLQVSTSESFTDFVLNQSGIEDAQFQLFDLAYNTTYFWRVNATNGTQISDWSEVWSFATEELFIGTPILISPTNNLENILTENVQFNWNTVEDADWYILQISKNQNFANYSEFIAEENSYTIDYLEYSKTYYWRVKAANEFVEGAWSEVWSFTTELATLFINLNSGWNTVSSFFTPFNANLFDIFSNLTEQVKVIKNGLGQICVPIWGINQIGNWNVLEGYQINVSANCSFSISGEAITPENTPIQLSAGWHLISYLRSNPMSIVIALQSISDNLLFAKNGMGYIYHPSYGINNIGDMLPGQGYWIYLTAPAVLIYPEN